MGLPTFRFTLSHTALGSIQISEPANWIDSKLKLERHEEFHSLIEYFEGSFIFYGEDNIHNGGSDFIRQVENLYGLDADLIITIDATFDDVNYENLFTGQLDLTGLQEVKDNKIEVPIIRNNLWSKFIARKDTPVNLRSTTDLDGNTVSVTDLVDINLTSQLLNQNFIGYIPNSTSYIFNSGIGGNDYIQLDFDGGNVFLSQTQKDEIIDEIEEKYTLPIIDNPTLPTALFELKFGGTLIVNNFTLVVRDPLDDTTNYVDADFKCYIHTTSTVVEIPRTDYLGSNGTTKRTRFVYSGSLPNLANREIIRFYIFNNSASTSGPIQLLADDQVTIGGPITYTTKLSLTLKSQYRSTSGQAYLIHDAFNSILNRITTPDRFYSEYYGSTVTNARTYAADGCGWKNVLMPGLQVRGYTFDEKQFSMSFDKCWKGANTIFNLGLGYDTIDGDEVIRIEEKEYFYDPSISLFVENVREISREPDVSKIFNRIEVGYNKWESESASGIDDPQTKKVYSTRIAKINNALTIYSDFIAASYAIEITRRQKLVKSKDYKFDNEIFIIAINPDDVSPDRYRPELNENFNSITGLLNPETRYNSILTPSRNALRWGNFWNVCLQKYQTSSLKFVSGDGNYDMSSDYNCTGVNCIAIVCDNLSEKQDLSLSAYGGNIGFLHLPYLYTIEIINFSWDDYLAIRNNRKKAIAVSQTLDNFKRFFIKELTYEICKSKCKMILWPFDDAPILVIDTDPPIDHGDGDEEEDCGERVRLLEDGDERITENLECRNLEDGVSMFFYNTSEITVDNDQYFYNTSELTGSNEKYFYNESEI